MSELGFLRLMGLVGLIALKRREEGNNAKKLMAEVGRR
jgi:hypothetical protein